MSKHTNGQYVISGGSDDYWTGTDAKTLRGAKCIASRTYQQEVGGKIAVAIVRGEQYEVAAIKYGYDAWTNAY